MGLALPLLVVAVTLEVAATSVLPRADGFRNPLWTSVVVAGYLASIWLLTIVVRHMDVSTAYAIWAGLGTALVAVVGVVLLGEALDVTKVAAVAMIVAGVVVLNLQGSHETGDHARPAAAVHAE